MCVGKCTILLKCAVFSIAEYMVDNGIPIIVAIRFDTGHQKKWIAV